MPTTVISANKNTTPSPIKFQNQILSLATLNQAYYAYLIDFLENLQTPSTIDNKWLAETGIALFKKKLLYFEALKLKERRLVMPTELSHDEAAILLAYVLPWRVISMAGNSSVLGVYQYEGPKSGTYDVNKEHQEDLVDLVGPRFKQNKIDETLAKIKRLSPIVDLTVDPDLVIVNNGLYSRQKDALTPFNPNKVYLSKLAVNYRDAPAKPVITMPDNEIWDVESWISDLVDNDPDTETLLWQVVSDFITANQTRNKAIWFYSEKGNNGKGTLGQLIKNLVGHGNYASLAVADFKHEFLKEQLIGSIGNIADENDVDMYIDSVRDYKASITGDDFLINRKYASPLSMRYLGTNIQMMNGLPRTRDKSDSFYRRLIIVPFLKSFTNNGERSYIKQDYMYRTDVLEYVLYKALHVTAFSEFTVPAKSLEVLGEYKALNSPVKQFWDELEDEFQWDLLPTQFLYDLFVSWFKRNNPTGKILGKRSFIDDLKKEIDQNPNWDDAFDKKIRSNNKMAADEPLISDYHLIDWMNTTAKTNNPIKLRNFHRKVNYRGVTRV